MAEEHNFEDYAKEVEKYRELMEEIQFHTRKVMDFFCFTYFNSNDTTSTICKLINGNSKMIK